MKIVLAALNAKYIHTCPAIYSLKAFAQGQNIKNLEIQTEEYTINDRYTDILDQLLSTGADVFAFSVYIWNVDRTRRLIRDIRKVHPDRVWIWAGGPEASYNPAPFLTEDGADLCMLGEGEETFAHLAANAASGLTAAPDIRGIAFLKEGQLCDTGMAAPVDIETLPFLYSDLSAFHHRILYYESSRGCPFSCAYCLSGKERGLRVKSLQKVKSELQYFLDQKVPQVKFVDRTFNADPVHAMGIWEYLRDHDNGVTNFHFEIEAGRMTQEELDLLSELRPGLVQLEIGVQSANPAALKSVHRSPELMAVAKVMEALTLRQNINLHLDLIAGLPFEDMKSFARSFQKVYEMRPHQLQLGFLKLLKGTELYDRREEYGLVCSQDAPYEVLKTRWLTYEDISLLHRISDRVEEYVNSQGFRRSLPLAEGWFDDAFSLFLSLAEYYREQGYEKNTPSVFKRYEVFRDFLEKEAEKKEEEGESVDPEALTRLLETVKLDQYLHTHPSRRMTAEAVLSPEGRERHYCFDYRQTSPVNGEAFFIAEDLADGPGADERAQKRPSGDAGIF